MSQLQVTPQVLADAGGILRVEQDTVARAAGAIVSAGDGIAIALPGSRTAIAAESAASSVAAAVRTAANELAALAVALSGAARHYATVEREAAVGLERAGRRPS
jgi:hypothetical protein